MKRTYTLLIIVLSFSSQAQNTIGYMGKRLFVGSTAGFTPNIPQFYKGNVKLNLQAGVILSRKNTLTIDYSRSQHTFEMDSYFQDSDFSSNDLNLEVQLKNKVSSLGLNFHFPLSSSLLQPINPYFNFGITGFQVKIIDTEGTLYGDKSFFVQNYQIQYEDPQWVSYQIALKLGFGRRVMLYKDFIMVDYGFNAYLSSGLSYIAQDDESYYSSSSYQTSLENFESGMVRNSNISTLQTNWGEIYLGLKFLIK